ncbi:MAG TPA: hypothetical protein VM243_17285 [Phycisphaerae bacterium]|nr:hypothetical protein [Phycisphaerae bacterium]
MKFRIIGAERQTGIDVDKTVDVENDQIAARMAHDMNVLVERIEPVQPSRPATPPEPPKPQKPYPIMAAVSVASMALGVICAVLGCVFLVIAIHRLWFALADPNVSPSLPLGWGALLLGLAVSLILQSELLVGLRRHFLNGDEIVRLLKAEPRTPY